MTILTLQPHGAVGIDTWMYWSSDNNYGLDTELHIGATAVNEPNRTLLKLYDGSIHPGSTINSATLSLYCDDESSATDFDVSVHRALREWWKGNKNGAVLDAGVDGSTWNLRNNNGSLTWGAAGGQSGVDYAATATATTTITGTGAWFNFDVKADVIAWKNGTANYGWFLINTSENTALSRKLFYSSDHWQDSTHPKLVVDWSGPTLAGVQVDTHIHLTWTIS